MANKQNLRDISEYNNSITAEERKANARRAGKASGKARKENKLIRDRIIERMGEGDWNKMIDNLILRAQDDTKSFEVLRDTIGQKPTERVDMNVGKSEKLDDIFSQLGGEGLEE